MISAAVCKKGTPATLSGHKVVFAKAQACSGHILPSMRNTWGDQRASIPMTGPWLPHGSIPPEHPRSLGDGKHRLAPETPATRMGHGGFA